jgi:hypothetical protein
MFERIPGHRITRQGDRGSGGGENDFAGGGIHPSTGKMVGPCRP